MAAAIILIINFIFNHIAHIIADLGLELAASYKTKPDSAVSVEELFGCRFKNFTGQVETKELLAMNQKLGTIKVVDAGFRIVDGYKVGRFMC